MEQKKKPPQTSIDAFRSLKDGDVKQTYNDILWALSILGKGTFQDIAKFLKCHDDKIWKRLSELGGKRFSLIHKLAETKKLKSGREGSLWALNSDTPILERPIDGKSISDYSKELVPKRPVGRPKKIELPTPLNTQPLF